jgi:hypothetical protein
MEHQEGASQQGEPNLKQVSGHSAFCAPPRWKAHVFVIETYDYYRNKNVKFAFIGVCSNLFSL